ncbi:MAG TPA: glucose-6-phosphate isomerase [Candidatus Omnitrophota bacterium]|nr:glucose-6-phosphate isomerase [Candidatus Omnitrophota bacterium]HRZ15533.1 glucose-6-phosphate isomerase [Candidatus Omnitrophota bacterium]
MKQLRFDFNNMFDFSIGKTHGVTDQDLQRIRKQAEQAHAHLQAILSDRSKRVNLCLEWAQLPFQDKAQVRQIQRLGNEIARRYENVISLGIGGSYLGLKAAQDALCPPYYNEFDGLRKGRPRIYFEGNNLDPETLSALLKNLDPRKTFVIVISKSGETTETKAAFAVVEPWLKKGAGPRYGRQIVCITDPNSGALRKKVNAHQAADPQSFRNLPLLKGVGGRYSELNMGLLHLAIVGVPIADVLAGAAAMSRRCAQPQLRKNPAYMYAALQTIAYRSKGKPIAILMPFAETLKSTADWYCQLLAESTGKKFSRSVKVNDQGREDWLMDKQHIVNLGRTPVPSRGTNDLHSIQQNNIEGANDKTVTFIRVESFTNDIRVPGAGDILSGQPFSRLLSLAQEATEWALVRQQRPNCTVIMPGITPYHWGGLLFFFEMATAFEGELLNINAFDQPGVEGYKNYMYFKLKKPGISSEISDEIKKNPLKKNKLFIL